jgi:hypothetical protein
MQKIINIKYLFNIKIITVLIKKQIKFIYDYNKILFHFLLLKYYFNKNIFLLKIEKSTNKILNRFSLIKSPFIYNKSRINIINCNYKSKLIFTFTIINQKYLKNILNLNNFLILYNILDNNKNTIYKVKIVYILYQNKSLNNVNFIN